MENEAKVMIEFQLLLDRLFDDEATEEEVLQIQELIQKQPELKKYYFRCVELKTGLHQMKSLDLAPCSPEQSYDDVIQALARYEKTAPAVDVAKEEPSKERIPKVVYRKDSRRVSKFAVFSAVCSAAALVFLVLLVRYAPVNQYSVDVATLVDQVHVKWSDSNAPLKAGDRLWTHQVPIGLEKGVVKIQYDDGVDVLVEGPAKFTVERSGLYLEYGRIFSRVSERGLGFIIETPTSRFVDMGTEFGVQADVNGSAELHVIKGRVQLFAGPKGKAKTGLEVMENQAVRYNANSFKISEIQVENQIFVRSIDSKANTLWRGHTQICLSDLVGGSGRQDRAIQWDGQRLVDLSQVSSVSPRSYVPVRFSPFIDGVFVPNSKGESVRLRSETAELDLDAFLHQDTNGLVTLMVLREDNDTASSFWFCSKEGASGDRAKMPSLYFPRGFNGQPATVTTADGGGADTCIIHDDLKKSDSTYGDAAYLACRYIQGLRLRIVYLRFDISQLTDLSGAVLNLCLDTGNRTRTLGVYGLSDGTADFWSEATLDYDTAPGLMPALLGHYALDERLCVRLGIFNVIDNRPSSARMAVSSDGSIQWTMPESVAQTAYAITNAGRIPDPLLPDRLVTLRLDNQPCGGPDNPSILMHANAGITFDLEAMRREYGPLASFTSLCGLSPSAEPKAGSPSASFHVLLDGKEVFSAVDMTPEDAPKAIDLDLAGQPRTLTLIATQGTDGSIDNDLCLFVRPRINLEQRP